MKGKEGFNNMKHTKPKHKKNVKTKTVSLKKELRKPVNDLIVQPTYSRQLLVLAVAIVMLISVIGTIIVLNELSNAEKFVDDVKAYQALNGMIVKQLQERSSQEKMLEDVSDTVNEESHDGGE